MKILIIISYFDLNNNCDGTQLITKKLAEYLISKGHDVDILTNGEGKKYEKINNIGIYRIKDTDTGDFIWSLKNDILTRFIANCFYIYNTYKKNEFKKLILDIKPDVIHMQNMYSLSPFTWKIAHKNKIPIIYTLHDCYLYCTRYLKCPRVEIKSQICCCKPTLLCKIYKIVYKKISQNLDYVTAPTNAILDLYINDGYFKGVKSKIINHSFNYDNEIVEQIYINRKKHLNNKQIINFLYMGRLESSKGVDLLLEEFNKLDTKYAELHIAGAGSLESLIRKYMVLNKRIKYHGIVFDESKNKLLQDCDILILPSIVFETFGLVLIEAYQYGLPVIGSNIGGIREIIDNKKTGILIKPQDKKELVNAIKYFTEKENIYNMLDNCKNKLKEFSYFTNMNEYINTYINVINSKIIKD